MRERKTVLLVDDEPTLRRLVRETLGESEYRLVEAANGGRALELIARERPDLVLLDVEMPTLNGYSVCRAIKSNPDRAQTKVIMLTARAQSTDIMTGADSGADGYLTKPFTPSMLRNAVRQLLADTKSG